MSKVFAVIDGQVFISQAVVEQAAQAIRKVVVMDCGTGELKLAEMPVVLGDEVLLEQLRKAAEEGARAGYKTALEDFRQVERREARVISEMSARAKADEALATYVMTLGRMAGDDAARDGKLFAAGIGNGLADEKPADSLWSIKIGVTPGGTFYCAGIGPA